jgi:segregation and condensation protein A
MAYKVKLNTFEGPFDLLVYLIENARMNIYDIQVSEITAQYMDYIERMQRLDVNVSSEFMVLAAELIELKSKMLLPRGPVDEDGGEDEDPRSGLVQKLLEYKRFKAISGMLSEREQEGRRIFEKPQEDISEYTDNPDETLLLNMPQFVAAFNAFIERKKKVQQIHEHYQRVERQKVSAEQRKDFIRALFAMNGSASADDPTSLDDSDWQIDTDRVVPFDEMVPDKNDHYDVALSFTSVLEMIRQRRVTADQAALFAEIYVKATEHLNDAPKTEDEPEETTAREEME